MSEQHDKITCKFLLNEARSLFDSEKTLRGRDKEKHESELSHLRTELSDAKALMDIKQDKKIYQLMMDKQDLYIKLEQLKGDFLLVDDLRTKAERKLGIARSGLLKILTVEENTTLNGFIVAKSTLDEMEAVK